MKWESYHPLLCFEMAFLKKEFSSESLVEITLMRSIYQQLEVLLGQLGNPVVCEG